MNIGRSEYTRLVRSEVRLKKAEKLLAKCFLEIKDSLEEYIADDIIKERSVEEVMSDPLSYYGELLNELKDFIENKENI